MKRVRIGNVVLDILRGAGVPAFTLRLGELDETHTPPDVRLVLECGRLRASTNDMLLAGVHHAVFTVLKDRRRTVWSHPQLGPVIEIRHGEGVIRVVMEEEEWAKSDSPVRQVIAPALVSALAPLGLRAIHAAAVQVNNQGLLLAGPSGVGKTSAVLAALAQGGVFLADDLVFLDVRQERTDVLAWGLGEPPRAQAEVWKRFPDYSLVHEGMDGKATMNLEVVDWTPSMTVDKLVLLRTGGAETPIRNQGVRLTNLLELTYTSDNKSLALKELSQVLQRVECSEILREKFPELLAFR